MTARKPYGPRLDHSAKFWSRVEHGDGCWLWTGPVDRDGYGDHTRYALPPMRRKIKAHRQSWEIHNGPIPDGLCVLHTCDNPPCVRPDHLFLGTNSDNVADKIAKGREARGEATGHSALTEADVRAILASDRSQIELAEEYGVDPGLIYHIRARRIWKHVESEVTPWRDGRSKTARRYAKAL